MKKFFKTDLALKIASVVIAIVMWFYVVQVQSPEIETTITEVPVSFTQKEALEAKGLTVLKDKEHTIDIKLRGRRKVIVDVNNTNITVLADVSKIDSPGTHSVATNVVLPIGGVEIVKKTPAALDIEVDELMTKELEVQAALTGEPEEGYVLGSVTLEPSVITVKGPRTVVEGISSLKVSADLTGKNADVTGVAPVQVYGSNEKEIKSPYITLSAETVQVTCPILKTRTVSVYPSLSGSLLEQDIAYELDAGSTRTVNIAGPADVVDALQFVRTEEIGSLENNEAQAGLLLPTGVRSLDGDRLSFRFVEKPRATKDVPVTDITAVNGKEGADFSILSQDVSVTLVGTDDALGLIQNTTGFIDLKGLGAGRHSVPLTLSYLENAWPVTTIYIDVEIAQ